MQLVFAEEAVDKLVSALASALAVIGKLLGDQTLFDTPAKQFGHAPRHEAIQVSPECLVVVEPVLRTRKSDEQRHRLLELLGAFQGVAHVDRQFQVLALFVGQGADVGEVDNHHVQQGSRTSDLVTDDPCVFSRGNVAPRTERGGVRVGPRVSLHAVNPAAAE